MATDTARKYAFTLTGVRPLLMHADNLGWADQDRRKATKRVRGEAGDDRGAAGKWASYLYTSPDGRVIMPEDNIDAALRDAGGQLKSGRKTLKDSFEAGVECCLGPEFTAVPRSRRGEATAARPTDVSYVAVRVSDADAAATYYEYVDRDGAIDLFVRTCKVQGRRHVRVRPRFDRWRVIGAIRVTDDRITGQQIAQAFEIAGDAGLGDWRPKFGRFTAHLSEL